jgi:hypothetical protein
LIFRTDSAQTTNHPEHETLALATLLNVDYERTEFQDAGIMKGTAPTDAELESMMKDLWELLDKTCPGSIPPGIIFLPGKRLSIPGFRWAPKTWMSAQEVDYPDPLANMTRAAKLVPEGLLVHYPGFLLHAKNRNSILKPNADIFHFPSDSTLLEWYSVNFKYSDSNASRGVNDPDKRLAIILCRERPRELHEIALLVQIEEEIIQRSFRNQRRSKIYRVSIDRRIKIWREVGTNLLSEWRSYITDSAGQDDHMICGEVLDSDQRWYIDGPREPEAEAPKVVTELPVDKRPDPPPKLLMMSYAATPAAATAVNAVNAATSLIRSTSRRVPMTPSISGQRPANPPPLPPRPGAVASASSSMNGANGAVVESRDGRGDFKPPPRTMSNQSGRTVVRNPSNH